MIRWVARRLRRSRLRREIDEEIRFHLDMRRAELRDTGMSRADANRATQTRFGDADAVRQAVYRVRHIPLTNGGGVFRGLWQDVRFGLRTFVRQPGFTALAVLTLVLGIGANSAIFGLVHSVVIDPWPFEDSDRLAWLWRERAGSMMIPPTPEALERWRASSQIEASVSLTWDEVAWQSDDGALALTGARAPAQLFPLLGVRPIAGRAFVTEDSVSGSPNVVMLGEGFWKNRFGGRVDVIGKTMELNGAHYEVVGVAPASLDRLFSRQHLDVWLPLRNVPAGTGINTLVRITPGATVASAEAELTAIDARAVKEEWEEAWVPRLVPPTQSTSRQLRTGLWILLGAVGLVLLIACANVANMLLARGIGRQHEMAIRTALGAGRWRLGRQLVTESMMVSLVGTAGGIGLALLALSVLKRTVPDGLVELKYANLSPTVLFATSLVGLLTGVLFGLVPIVSGVLQRSSDELRRGPRGGEGVSHARFRVALIVCEVALAFILFTGAGLLVRSFMRLSAVDPGFSVDRIVTVRFELPESRYPNATSRHAFVDGVLARVRQLPQVSAATFAMGVPPRMGARLGAVEIEGRSGVYDPRAGVVSANRILPDYFLTLGIPVLTGRVFQLHDAGLPFAVVNEQFAREMWPGTSALGGRFRWEGQTDWTTVIGIVGDVKAFGLADAAERAQVYTLFSPARIPSSGVLLARAEGDPADVIAMVQGQVNAVDARIPIRDAATVEEMFSESVTRQRFNTFSLTAFAILALILAVTGVYGVITLAVNQRIREIGVRLALGAKPGQVQRWMLFWGMRPVVLGLGIGLVASLSVRRLIESLLYDVPSGDVPTYGVAMVTMVAIAALAVYIPARRAGSIDPNDILRDL